MDAVRLALLIGLVATMSAARAGAAPEPSATTTTLMTGWEQHFTIEWTPVNQTPSTRKITGFVYNNYGAYATRLQVLAQATDSAGAVAGQRIQYVPEGVGGYGRVYFEVPNLPATEHYRVSIWDYTWIQGPGFTR
jgi:hypothetical protein